MGSSSVQRASALLAASACFQGSLASFASWYGMRGVQVQNIIALEGGLLSNGTYKGNGQWSDDTELMPHNNGLYFQMDLKKPFNRSAQTPEETLTQEEENTDPRAPNFVNGGMFHNDFQWYTFGGQNQQTVRPGMNSVNQGNLFANNYGQTQPPLGVSPYNNHNGIGSGVYENISAGASASSGDPSQRLGWFFGGVSRADYSTFKYPLIDTDVTASPTFYKVDMGTSTQQATFSNLTWPANQDARAEGALVWLPYGKSGVLVAIGGVAVPADVFVTPPAALPNDNTYMTDLLIYDIDADTWYTQSTLETGKAPPQLAKFCTAVVATKDGNSQEIFVYGGYDGSGKRSPTESDDVWVLSVPAFQWTLVYNPPADSNHGRSGPVCFSPNPTSLISIGGSTWNGGSLSSDTIIDVFNLTSLEWDGVYDPSSETQFKAPDAVVSQLSWPNSDGPGSVQVGAVSDSSVSSLFNTAYPTNIKPYWPYASATPTQTAAPTSSPNKWKIPVIAVLCSVIPLLIIAIVVFCCLKKRRQHKQAVTRTQRSRGNVFSWFSKDETDPAPEKSNSSEDTAVDPHGGYFPKGSMQTHEVEGQPSGPTSPGWPSYGVPSPGLSAAMASSRNNERYEIMDHPAKRESAPFRDHPYYPRSLDGDHILDVRSQGDTSVSSPSNNHRYSQTQTSPSELPHDRSHEHLPLPPTDLALGEPRQEATKKASNNSMGVGADQFYSPVASIPPSPIMRKPVNTGSIDAELSQRPSHMRNQSSISSHMPNLPSPTIEEDHRRSQRIDSLPDSPSTPPHTQIPTKKSSGPLKSAYKENLDDEHDPK